MEKNQKRIIVGGFLLCIIAFAFFVRKDTFWIAHSRGDQFHYITLAMKLDKLGFKYYNLRGVRIRYIHLLKNVRLVYVAPASDPSEKGDLLKILDMFGIHYYDQPFFHKPPAFPYALLLSHKVFAKKNQPYVVVSSDFSLGKLLRKNKVSLFLEAQFYATIVPLFFSLGLILITFFLGKLLFSSRVGLYAAFIMAINPVDIMSSQRIWADDMLSFFAILSVTVFVIAMKKNYRWLFFLAGVLCGIAVLTKQTGGYLLIAIGIFSILVQAGRRELTWQQMIGCFLITIGVFSLSITLMKKIFNWVVIGKHLFLIIAGIFLFLGKSNQREKVKFLPSLFFNREFVLFSLGTFLVCGFWFVKIYKVYGNPLWLPTQSHLLQEDISGWFRVLKRRPPGWLLFPLGGIYLCPLFALAGLSIKRLVITAKEMLTTKNGNYNFLFLGIVILTFYFMVGPLKEHRYMLPVYPLIAILSGYYWDKFRQWLARSNKFLRCLAEVIIIVLFILCAFWSVSIGINVIREDKLLLRKPF
ncbi:MAG: hypothetical protein B6D56_01010 [Candidatus Omnitrophica bacterium 4484_70.1]|nr:MAG: hypothetical protein B6D56_01010 [Candidatus Omnitrophica bacterium 4484_70.1]